MINHPTLDVSAVLVTSTLRSMPGIDDEIHDLLGELGEVHDHLIGNADYCLQMLSGLAEDSDENNPIDESDLTAVKVCEFARQELPKLQAAYAAYTSQAGEAAQSLSSTQQSVGNA